MLSLRLQAIADFIPERSNVIDIGCDHALLDIYLAKYKDCTCLASDININCLNKAISNISKYNLNNKIKTAISNGLENITYNDDDYIVISGMGFHTILNILKFKKPKKLIIQSNTELEKLRYELGKYYIIEEEKTIRDNGKYYAVLYLIFGNKKYKTADYLIGINKNNYNYIEFLYKKNKQMLKNIPNKYLFKKISIFKKIIVLNSYLKKH